jgi:ABC-type multidrug transport system ATPase subunit
MKQKLLAALALAADTQVLVCDEPTANLDRAARAAFFQQAAERRKDSVMVLCSHRVEEIERLDDRVVEMDAGRIVGDRPVAELSHAMVEERDDRRALRLVR